jgi:hypothetical protein
MKKRKSKYQSFHKLSAIVCAAMSPNSTSLPNIPVDSMYYSYVLHRQTTPGASLPKYAMKP